MIFGTISYLSDDLSKRERRRKVALQCIEHLSQVASIVDEPLHIVTTNWREEDFNACRSFCAIEPIFHMVPMEKRSCGYSRNILLNILYESDEDYMLVSDDDNLVIIDDEFKRFITHIHNSPSDFYNRNIFMMLSSGSVGFFGISQTNVKSEEWIFTHGHPIQIGSPSIHPNTRKHFDKDILIPDFALTPDNQDFREDFYRYIEIAKCGTSPKFCSAFKSRMMDFASGSTIWSNGWECASSTENQMKKYYPKAKTALMSVDMTAYLPDDFEKEIRIPKR